MKVAEMTCWDLVIILKIFGLGNRRNSSLIINNEIFLLFCLFYFMCCIINVSRPVVREREKYREMRR